MGYKMKTTIQNLILDHGAVQKQNLGDVHGVTLDDGTIVVNSKLSNKQQKETMQHERVHRDQILRKDLSYDEENVYWKGKKYPRSKMNEGAHNLPWEKEAYKKTKK